jgi:hypothetical protein
MLLFKDYDQTRKRWNLYELREVCNESSQEVQDEGLCKSKYFG